MHTRLIELFGAGKQIERRSTFNVVYRRFSCVAIFRVEKNEKEKHQKQKSDFAVVVRLGV